MIRTVLAAILVLVPLGGTTLQAQELEKAVFAGGCFWCVESDFDKIPGVVATVSGYTGGTVENPTYRQVTAGGTGHREAVEITFDPAQVAYQDLLHAFWRSVDPTDAGGQFCDRGFSYGTAVYVADAEQRAAAEESKTQASGDLGQEIVTPIEMAAPFYPAEEYHQDYYQKSRLKYRYYRWSCGRNARVKEIWGESAYAGIPDH